MMVSNPPQAVKKAIGIKKSDIQTSTPHKPIAEG
jgi:hypothetical protein